VLANVNSPWLIKADRDEIYTVPISHGEGRFLADEQTLARLLAGGQLATVYVDERGQMPGGVRNLAEGFSIDGIQYNPNGSALSVEGIVSPDGRILGKMGHSERVGTGLYKNVEGNYRMGLFESAAEYYR
jgi:phosphoribosylformylglycinamidine synthase